MSDAVGRTPTHTPPIGPLVPSTGAPSSLAGAGGKMGKDEFLKLLVAQMQNRIR
jgi:flagellar hook assembly protein FlgD